MRIVELARYNIPEKIIDAWINEMGEDLLPVQERAIKRYHVLDGTNLLISSPAALGKTFIGEIAAVKGAIEKKKIVCLVPLKSIAEEKYLDFQKKYEHFGIRIVVSTKDHREYDRMIEAGEFGIAVIVYEKMSQLMVKNPLLLRNIAIIIIDELQEIGDPDRGPGLEVTLTKVIASPHHLQIIGLSAVLGNAEVLARWLGTDLLSHDRWPIELHDDAVFKALFHYKVNNTFKKKTEALTDMASYNSTEILMANMTHLVERSDQLMVLLPSKVDTMIFARILTDRVNFSCASGALKDLAFLEETSLKKGLNYCLQKSIAFHHADLSREERNIVEKYARKGEIKVIFSMITLAMDVNLPATTVFLHTKKWETNGCNHMILTPIGWAEYENISGHVGRQGLGQDFGKSIAIERNDCEHPMFGENYNERDLVMATSRLNGKGLEDHLINIMASGFARNREELETFLSRTFMGLSESREAVRKNLEKALQFLLHNGLVKEDCRGEMSISSLGEVVALKGITCLTAMDLVSFLREVGDRELTNLEVLHAVASSDDGKRVYIQIAQHEHKNKKYEQFVREIFYGQQDYMGTLLSCLIKSPLLLTENKAKTRKHILQLDRWIRGNETPPLERDFESYYGAIAAAAEGLSWITDAAALIAQCTGFPKSLQDRLSILSERLLYGVDENGLELARLRVRGLGRAGIIKLVREGFESGKVIRETPVKILATMIPEKTAISLKQAVERDRKAPAETTVVEIVSPDDTFICCDRIEITGKPMEKRNLVMINGSPAGITNRSLELLLRFAVALKKDGRGWVHREDLTSGIGTTQLISRVRNELISLTLTKDVKIIENDGSGSYRLSIPPQNAVIDTERLQKHWNAVIKELAKSV